MSWLKQHPFAVEAFFDRSLVLTYAFPKEKLEGLLPACLALDTFRDEYAFVAAAIVQTRHLRPKGLPRLFGRDFLLMGYRVFVRYVNQSGKRLRGLYILKTETDRKSMELLGNFFTHYRYEQTSVVLRDEGPRTLVQCEPSGLNVIIDREEDAPLPEGSPFSQWKDARKFAGPMPFTFSVEKESRRVVIIEGVRQNWKPRSVRVVEHQIPFVTSLTDATPALASAFMTEKIPYWWKKGVVEPWTD